MPFVTSWVDFILQEFALLQGKDVMVDGKAVNLPYSDLNAGVLVKFAGRFVVMSLLHFLSFVHSD